MRIHAAVFAIVLAGSCLSAEEPKTAYFVDGYHGGIYGHYPPGYTAFLVEQLKANPNWKINLEIEPETWDVARVAEPEAYQALRALMSDHSSARRIEVVNPTYAQSYLFHSSGESVIRQFDYGIRSLRTHFPGIPLTTYSSEEPCFTSCLPTILKSFGYQSAVLKNPNTCWGGYTAPHGGELVNWVGPDGTRLLTVPRYECEAFVTNSSWETIANRNTSEYLEACFKQGIQHPVGMCLQDAGWRGGPWIGKSPEGRRPTSSKYVTWTDYIRNVTPADWRVSQEDVKPGLMWGAQILQRIAQQSRQAEHHLLTAEKLSAMAFVEAGRPMPTDAFDQAWHGVLLSQHHDCWIVPYNGRPGSTWADKVSRWTAVANAVSDLAIDRAFDALHEREQRKRGQFVRIYNPTATPLDAVVPIPGFRGGVVPGAISIGADGRTHSTQVVSPDKPGQDVLLVRASLPPLGYASVQLVNGGTVSEPSVTVVATDQSSVIESDHYHIEFDAAKGGTINSLVAKRIGNHEFVDLANERRFNELRGHFYDEMRFHSSADQPAKVRVLERGPLRATVEITGSICNHPFVQRVSITQGSPVIDCSAQIDWRSNPRIGEFEENDGFKNRRRAAYDDRFKLLVLFPSQVADQKLVKGAPYDVCESTLEDTFFKSWEAIKNNVILDWVDVTDRHGHHGLALFTDHTTSYVHGPKHPLGLTLQYSGKGLWGRDYRVDGPTEVRYALVPHTGRWDQANVPALSAGWQEPPLAISSRGGPPEVWSLLDPGMTGWAVTAMFERDGKLFGRLFNATGEDVAGDLGLGFDAGKVELVELDGRIIQELKIAVNETGGRTVRLQIPRFGVRTLRLSDVNQRH